MSRALLALQEFVNPGSVRRPSVPPMDAGLRPNDLLDSAPEIVPPASVEPDDVVIRADGTVWFSSGTEIWSAASGAVSHIADLGAPVGALGVRGDAVVAAVQDRGLVEVGADGGSRTFCADAAVQSCVTDLSVLPDGDVLVCVGSRRHATASDWGRALLHGDRSGELVRVGSTGAAVVAECLGWPAGVAPADDGDVLVSLGFGHEIQRRSLGRPDRAGSAVVRNLAFYPGRIRSARGGWWVAAPYVRNRATELVLDEPALCRDLVMTVHEGEWPLPRLRMENPYRDPLQLGQLRVLGVLKPWAPPRSYGLVVFLGSDGRIHRSFHSRVDGSRHGVTGVFSRGSQLVVALRGARSLLDLEGVQ